MLKLKNLFLVSTAGLMTVTGVQAADLPVAEPVEYVRVCDAFGTGFFYIPGTDTCLKIDGYARYEAHWVDDDDDFFGTGDDSFNNFTTRARGQVNFDARTMTDLGLLRSYIALRGTIGPTDTGGYSDGFNIDKAWISLANDSGTLTAGHHGSFFDFFGGSAMNTRIGGDDPTISTNLLAYTFAVGNGVSASVSIEDKTFRRVNTIDPLLATLIATGTILPPDGQEFPDLVANIRVDQGWGSAQVMGAVGRVGWAPFTVFGTTIPADDEIGWAVGAGLSVGVPGTGIGFDIQGGYAEGLISYVTTGNHALVVIDAAPVAPGGSVNLSTAWAVQAALSADVTSNVSVSLDGAYADVELPGGLASIFDFDTWIVAGTVHWKPVSGLTISAEVAYEEVDYDVLGFDDDIWGAMMRINRTF